MSSSLTISTTDDRNWYRPGDIIEGEINWRLEEEADALEIRLFWYTSGKGTRDVEIVDSARTARPERNGSHRFRFRLPQGPYSFSGKLITLTWALEAVVDPGGLSDRLNLVIGPQPVEVDLR